MSAPTTASLPERARGAMACVDLAEVVGREVTLQKRGRGWWGRCPFHKERTPSFKVDPARQNYHCFGCGAHGDALDYIQGRDGLSFAEAVEALEIEAGIRPDAQGCRKPLQAPRPAPAPDVPDWDETARMDAARALWAEASPIPDTVAETYLRGRGITIPPPPSLRYNPNLEHGPTGLFFPALVAAIQGPDGKLTGVQRTYLQADGSAKAGVHAPRMSLGRIGAGAVRLGAARPALGIAEGIESGLAAMQLHELPLWCALGTRLACVELPDEVREVHIFADNDSPGRQAANEAVEAFTAARKRCVLRFPPEGFGDWNDALRAEVPA